MKKLFADLLDLKDVNGIIVVSFDGDLIFEEFSAPLSERPESRDWKPFVESLNGAKGIEPNGGELGPNSRYFGVKKDMDLLFASHTPELADMGQVRRRAMLASMVKPAMKKIRNLGLLGAVGALLAKELVAKDSKK